MNTVDYIKMQKASGRIPATLNANANGVIEIRFEDGGVITLQGMTIGRRHLRGSIWQAAIDRLARIVEECEWDQMEDARILLAEYEPQGEHLERVYPLDDI